MKNALKIAILSLVSLSAQAQTHKMWVNAPAANLREQPAATSHVMLKLGAPAEVTVFDDAKEYKKNPSLKGKWAQVMFSPYLDGGTSWAGWIETKYLVAARDSVKVAPAAALFTVPSDEKVYPKRSGVKGVPYEARSTTRRVYHPR